MSVDALFPLVFGVRDERVLAHVVMERRPDSALTLDPSGDTAVTLLSLGVPEVWARVPDDACRALLDLKLAACRALPPQGVRALFGLDSAGRRVWFYHYVREHLPPRSKAWWDEREGVVRAGIAQASALDHALRPLRRAIRWSERLPGRTPGRPPGSALRLALLASHLRAPAWIPTSDPDFARRWEALAALPGPDRGRFVGWAERGAWGPDDELPPWIAGGAAGGAREAPQRLVVLLPGESPPRRVELLEGLGPAVDGAALESQLVPGGRAIVWGAGAATPRGAAVIPTPWWRATDRSPFTTGLTCLELRSRAGTPRPR